MSWKWYMIFCRIFKNFWHLEHTRGPTIWPRGYRACPTPWGAPPTSWDPRGPPPLIPAPTHFVFLQKKSPIAQTRVLAHLAAIFDLFAQSSIHKTVLGVVLRYVTPPMVQLVFVLVLYLLQIFATKVTLFLSLHVIFILSQVVIIHDVVSRHLWE